MIAPSSPSPAARRRGRFAGRRTVLAAAFDGDSSSPTGSSSRRPTTAPSTLGRRGGHGGQALLQRRRRSGALHVHHAGRSSTARRSRSPIGSSGLSPVLARWIKGVIETLATGCASARSPTRGRAGGTACREQLTRTRRAPRHFWERVAQRRVVAEHAFAGPRADAERALEARARELGQRRRRAPRRGLSVGAGPGGHRSDHVRGRQLLATADVVLYDRLASPSSCIRAPRRRADLRRQDTAAAVDPQNQLNRLLVARCSRASASAGSKAGIRSSSAAAARRAEGARRGRAQFQVVPGVSAARAARAYAGIPLTLRAS